MPGLSRRRRRRTSVGRATTRRIAPIRGCAASTRTMSCSGSRTSATASMCRRAAIAIMTPVARTLDDEAIAAVAALDRVRAMIRVATRTTFFRAEDKPARARDASHRWFMGNTLFLQQYAVDSTPADRCAHRLRDTDVRVTSLQRRVTTSAASNRRAFHSRDHVPAAGKPRAAIGVRRKSCASRLRKTIALGIAATLALLSAGAFARRLISVSGGCRQSHAFRRRRLTIAPAIRSRSRTRGGLAQRARRIRARSPVSTVRRL